jgi:hypothetical protein
MSHVTSGNQESIMTRKVIAAGSKLPAIDGISADENPYG